MFSYSKAAVERAMKIQEVVLRAMAKKITWWQAAEILGFSDRHLRRIRERYQQFGYESMFDKRRSQPSPKRVPFATVEKVLALLHLIKMWLEAPVEETDERGNKHRSMRNRDEGRGTPQGSPISPLLSNLYMRRFVLGWKKLGHEKRWKAYIVNYADDLVICCRVGAEQALAEMRMMMSKLKLTMNEAKTRVCYPPEEKFDFLGYTFGRCYSMRRGRVYLGTVPSQKRVQRICRAISDETGRDTVRLDPKAMVEKLNRMLIGWANYFCLGAVSQAYSAVDLHARRRLRRWLCDKHEEARPGYKRFPEASLHCVYGLVQLPHRTARLPWAKA